MLKLLNDFSNTKVGKAIGTGMDIFVIATASFAVLVSLVSWVSGEDLPRDGVMAMALLLLIVSVDRFVVGKKLNKSEIVKQDEK